MNRFNKKLTLSLPEDPIVSQPIQSLPIDIHTNQKESYYNSGDGGECVDFEYTDNRNDNSNKLNFIEFQEFNLNDPNIPQNGNETKIYQDKNNGNNQQSRHKKTFTIQLPEKEEQTKNKKYYRNRGEKCESQEIETKFKEPPAPSKGSKYSKVFVFPSNSPKKVQTKESQNLEQIKQSFQRERLQFYKEKSKLEQQIMVKNGQIQMLEKIVKDKYSPTNSSAQANNYMRTSNYRRHIDYQEIEGIILQKDIQISELLQRINYLSECIDKKNQDLNQKVAENCNLEAIIESLRNQLFIYEKKQLSEKLTTNFYKFRGERKSREVSKERDYGMQRNWDGDDVSMMMNQKDFGSKGLANLQKRLDNLHKNRLDLDHRSKKIYSDINNHPHSTRNVTHGHFDFNNRLHQPNKKLNKSKKF